MLHLNPSLSYSGGPETLHVSEANLVPGGHAFNVQIAAQSGRKLPGADRGTNEDAGAVGIRQIDGTSTLELFIADGATSFVPISDLGNETGAHFVSNRLVGDFAETPDDLGADLILPWLNRRLGNVVSRFSGVSLDQADTLPTATGIFIRLNPDTGCLEVSDVGDSVAIAAYEDGTTQKLNVDTHSPLDEELFAYMRQLVVDDPNLDFLGARSDRRVIAAIRKMFRDTRNISDGIINGDPRMERFVHYAQWTGKRVTDIAAMTDGGVPPHVDVNTHEGRRHIIDSLRSVGPVGLITEVTECYDADPDGAKYTRYKHQDDALVLYAQRVA